MRRKWNRPLSFARPMSPRRRRLEAWIWGWYLVYEGVVRGVSRWMSERIWNWGANIMVKCSRDGNARCD